MVINEPGRHEQPKWAALSARERPADVGTPQSAPEPSQTATEAHSDAERRHWNVSDDALRDATARLDARDAEVERLRAIVKAQGQNVSPMSYRDAMSRGDALQRRALKAEAKVARAEELANEWDAALRTHGSTTLAPVRFLARDLRAALADPEAEATESCPTCSWPRRETSGLVCQTCGWDYAKGEKPAQTTEGGA